MFFLVPIFKAMERLDTNSWIKRNLKGDPVIWAIVFIFSLISIAVVYSATGTLAFSTRGGNTEYFLLKHSMLIGLGLFSMYLAHLIDFKYYSRLAQFGVIISIPLLLYTWLFGASLNEANRWITIPIINQTFMPSDLAKLSLVSYLASMLSKKQGDIEDLTKTFLPILGWCFAICGLIAMTDLSSAAMLFSACILLMFIGRVPMKYIGGLMIVGVLAGSIALAVGQRAATAASRIEKFASGELSYQSEQAHIAISNGGIIRFAPGQSVQRNFLPHPYSDFIYAIIIEEYGMLGGAIVLFLYLTLLYRGMVTVARSNKAFGGLLSAGLSFLLVIQAMINMGVTVGLGPVTGLPLPMLSMGGTSLLFTGLALGIIISVSRGERVLTDEGGNTLKRNTVFKDE